jgi:sugar O-acyltransferase (sialic acid O-acetyltransferase NeuD family)
MFDLIIIGAGGFGRELHEMLEDVFLPDEYRFKGFLAADRNPAAERLGPILGDPESYEPAARDRFLLAIGQMGARRKIAAALAARGATFASFVHPLARVARSASIGAGAVIYPMAVVSNCARLGENVHLNYFASVGHDAQVGRDCLLAPYATLNGFCVVEEGVYLSTHSTVTMGVRIGKISKVSANSCVTKEVPAESFVFGVPGRVVKGMVGRES